MRHHHDAMKKTSACFHHGMPYQAYMDLWVFTRGQCVCRLLQLSELTSQISFQ
mgnify:CR=1 FL=1